MKIISTIPFLQEFCMWCGATLRTTVRLNACLFHARRVMATSGGAASRSTVPAPAKACSWGSYCLWLWWSLWNRSPASSKSIRTEWLSCLFPTARRSDFTRWLSSARSWQRFEWKIWNMIQKNERSWRKIWSAYRSLGFSCMESLVW